MDFFVVDEVIRRRTYLPLPGWIRHADIIVDVGAHIGTFAILASRLAHEGKVVALEPYPENFAMLRRNVRLNGCRNITAAQLALAARSGRSRLFISPYNTGGHSFYLHSSRSIDVESIDFDGLIQRFDLPRIDVLKMDCEGAEHEILPSIPDQTLRSIRRIILECHDISLEFDHRRLVKVLQRSGFEVSCTNNNLIWAQRPSDC